MTELMPSLCNDCVARNQCGKDDVKMCISYTKETKIKCDDCKFVDNCVDYGWEGCKKFTPTPSEPMTNEERMRTCSTEELAIVIYGIAVYDTLYDRIHNAVVLNPCEDDSAGINEVMKWLKEAHE